MIASTSTTGRARQAPGRMGPLAALAFALALIAGPAAAETGDLRIGSGFGIHYLPFYVMEKEHLVEKQAAAAGLPPLKVSYIVFSGGAALNDAVISGAVDLAGVGVGPFAILWDKTRSSLKVRAVAAMGDIPSVLLTDEPRIKTLEDVRDGDRIALPAVKASLQATLLQMAAADIWGDAKFDQLDQNTVSLAHSDAATALLSRSGVVDLHFSVAPYATREQADPGIHKILDTKEIVGGPMSLNLVSSTDRFYTGNPKVTAAFVAALAEANAIIASDRPLAAKAYFEGNKGAASDVHQVEQILADPDYDYTIVPHGIGRFVGFMYRIGLIKHDPASWKDLFFPDAQSLAGN